MATCGKCLQIVRATMWWFFWVSEIVMHYKIVGFSAKRIPWSDVIWQWTFREAIHQEDRLANNSDQHWNSIKSNQKSYRTCIKMSQLLDLKTSQLSQNVLIISKCGSNYLKMSQLPPGVDLRTESNILEELFPWQK